MVQRTQMLSKRVIRLKTHDLFKLAQSKFLFLCANESVLSLEHISSLKKTSVVLVSHR